MKIAKLIFEGIEPKVRQAFEQYIKDAENLEYYDGDYEMWVDACQAVGLPTDPQSMSNYRTQLRYHFKAEYEMLRGDMEMLEGTYKNKSDSSFDGPKMHDVINHPEDYEDGRKTGKY